MAVSPLLDDQAKILGNAGIMAVQNFGFFIMYLLVWSAVPSDAVCDETRFSSAFMAMTCFYVTFAALGMGMGGYVADDFLFWFYWILHLFGGGTYTLCTFLIPLSRFSATGEKCAAINPANGDLLRAVYLLHAALYWFYVSNMLSVTYFSFIKPTFKLSVNPVVVTAGFTAIIALCVSICEQKGYFPNHTVDAKAMMLQLF